MKATMRLQGLKKVGIIEVPAVKAVDLVESCQTYALGDGMWSIEAKTSADQSVWGPAIAEWVGSNGTREPEDDLWAQVEEWAQDPNGGQMVVKEAYSYVEYEAPDGTKGSKAFFYREAKKGFLHGLLLRL